ncbi:unnamed protein product [Eruca vesicaria subsp. sativa]|uniref:Uncharacterized protein n=1 Tax=Eruca vesicaria subsp. sativa TaxID=29727 RepID=A0ABC8M9A0_ERUVS|nr:unnamed protein product [Eruca vesicaria subsp. sativa]
MDELKEKLTLLEKGKESRSAPSPPREAPPGSKLLSSAARAYRGVPTDAACADFARVEGTDGSARGDGDGQCCIGDSEEDDAKEVGDASLAGSDVDRPPVSVDEARRPVVEGGRATGQRDAGRLPADSITALDWASDIPCEDPKGKRRLPLPLMGRIPRVYPNFSELLDSQLGDESFDPAAALEAENEKARGSHNEGDDPPVEDSAVDEAVNRDVDVVSKKKKKKSRLSKRTKPDSPEMEVAADEVVHEGPSGDATEGNREVVEATGSIGEDRTGPSAMKKKKRPIDDRPSDSGSKRSKGNDGRPAPPPQEVAVPVSRNLPWSGSGPPNGKPPLAQSERWSFHHKDDTAFVNDEGACAELSRHIRGGSSEMPEVGDLAFPRSFAESARADAVASARKNFLVLECELAMRKMALDLRKAEATIKTQNVELEKARKSALERAKEMAVERSRIQRERKQAIEKADGLEEDLENARTKIAQLEREKVEETEKHRRLVDFMKQGRIREVTSERGRLMTAAAARFNKFRKYMADRDKLETKLFFHAQALGTLQSLDVLEKRGQQIPQRMRDTLTFNEKKFKREVEEADVEEITERDLSLSPPRSGPFQGLDQFGTNLGLVDSTTAVSLRSPTAVVETITAVSDSRGVVRSIDADAGGAPNEVAGIGEEVLVGEMGGAAEGVKVSAERPVADPVEPSA